MVPARQTADYPWGSNGGAGVSAPPERRGVRGGTKRDSPRAMADQSRSGEEKTKNSLESTTLHARASSLVGLVLKWCRPRRRRKGPLPSPSSPSPSHAKAAHAGVRMYVRSGNRRSSPWWNTQWGKLQPSLGHGTGGGWQSLPLHGPPRARGFGPSSTGAVNTHHTVDYQDYRHLPDAVAQKKHSPGQSLRRVHADTYSPSKMACRAATPPSLMQKTITYINRHKHQRGGEPINKQNNHGKRRQREQRLRLWITVQARLQWASQFSSGHFGQCNRGQRLKREGVGAD